MPLTVNVRLEATELATSVSRLRAAADALFGPDRAGRIAELFRAVDELEAIVAAPTRVPFSDQVLLDPERYYDRLDSVRAAVLPALAQRDSDGDVEPGWVAVLVTVDALEQLLIASERTLRPWITVDADALRNAASRVRVSATQTLGPHPQLAAALAELVEPAADAAPGDDVRLSTQRAFELVGRVHDLVVEFAAG